MPRKNVLALVSGVAAVLLAALPVWWGGEPLSTLGSTAAAVLAFAWGVRVPPRRTALVLMSMAAGSAALFFHFDSF